MADETGTSTNQGDTVMVAELGETTEPPETNESAKQVAGEEEVVAVKRSEIEQLVGNSEQVLKEKREMETTLKGVLFDGKVPEGKLGQMIVNGYDGPLNVSAVAEYLGELNLPSVVGKTLPDTSTAERVESVMNKSSASEVTADDKVAAGERAIFGAEDPATAALKSLANKGIEL